MLWKKLACYRWFNNLSQNKLVQHLNLKLFSEFFKTKQPIDSINKCFNFFNNELVYSKYLMVSKLFRNEIRDQYPEIINHNRLKWAIFQLYNIASAFFTILYDNPF
jgi:hypothetical protein